MRMARVMTSASAAGLVVAGVWWRTHPSACPYSQRFWVRPSILERDARRAGFTPEHRIGSRLGYLARFRSASPAPR